MTKTAVRLAVSGLGISQISESVSVAINWAAIVVSRRRVALRYAASAGVKFRSFRQPHPPSLSTSVCGSLPLSTCCPFYPLYLVAPEPLQYSWPPSHHLLRPPSRLGTPHVNQFGTFIHLPMQQLFCPRACRLGGDASRTVFCYWEHVLSFPLHWVSLHFMAGLNSALTIFFAEVIHYCSLQLQGTYNARARRAPGEPRGTYSAWDMSLPYLSLLSP